VWTETEIITWLATLGIGKGLACDVTVVVGPYVPKMPDTVAVVTTIAGPGETMDGVLDTGGFQLRIRGRQDPTQRSTSAARLAHLADRLIRRAPLPAEVVPGVRLLPVTRSGGRPSPLPTPDPGDRVEFTTTYLTPVLEALDG